MAQSDDDMQERHTIDVVGTGSVDGLVEVSGRGQHRQVGALDRGRLEGAGREVIVPEGEPDEEDRHISFVAGARTDFSALLAMRAPRAGGQFISLVS